MDTNKSASFPIDGGTCTLKTHSGLHLFCQKENLPAGVAYKNLAILSCAAALLEQLARLKANHLKLRSRPGMAKLLPAKKLMRNVYCQVCFAMKLSWQHRAAVLFFLVNARTSV